MHKSDGTLIAVRSCARLFAAALFTFLAAFFIEHTWQWFVRPFPEVPSFSVWLGQLLHFLILAGLLIAFRWELAGGIMTVTASVFYFVDKSPLFIPLTILPGVLFLYCWCNSQPTRQARRHSSRPTAPASFQWTGESPQ
jgi:hypothetical protein